MGEVREKLTVVDNFSTSMNKFNNLGSRMAKTLLGFAGVTALTGAGFIALSDQVSETTARLEAIKGEFAKVADLQDAIFAAAQRSRGSYADMQASVASLVAQTGKLFDKTSDAVRFTELLNKQFAISGTSAAGIQSTMYNMTQALSTGVLRGGDFVSIMSNAPAIVGLLAKEMGVTQGEVKGLAAEGKITAEIVKAAILNAGDDINKQFEKMPMTFGQAMQKLKNVAIKAFEPIGERISNLINSADFQSALVAFSNGIQIAVNLAIKGFELMGRIISFVRENLDRIAPVLKIIVATLIVYNTIMAIATAITTAYGVVTGIAATAKGIYAAATVAAAAGQNAFNAALAACPITWIVVAIMAAIAVVIALIYAFHQLAQTGHTVFGDILGVIVGVFSAALNLLAIVANAFISAAEWILNAWRTAVYNIQMAIYNFVIGAADAFNSVIDAADGAASAIANAFIAGANLAIGAINGIISALNMIPGISIGSVSTLGQVDSVISKRIDTSGIKAPTAPSGEGITFGRFETTSMKDAYLKGFNKGSAIGDSAQNGLMDAISGLKGNVQDLFNVESDLAGSNYELADAMAAGGLAGGGGGGKANVGTVDKVKDVHLSDEDTKIYRDLAERRYMANVELQTLAPNISVSIPESAAKNLTSQDIADKIKTLLIDQAAAHTAVAHAH